MSGRTRRILIAYDGSEAAQVALELGIELGRATGAAIGIIAVVPPEPGVAPDDPWSETSAGAAALFEARRRGEAAGLTVQTHEPTGSPGPLIVAVAAEFAYDTIVVGSRRLGSIRRTLLGSVSTYVAKHATATTVIAR